jgi:hypothetical protein
MALEQFVTICNNDSVRATGGTTSTEKRSRNIPNIGKNVPDTMCGLGDIRNNFQHIPDTE